VSHLDEFTAGRFHEVIDDSTGQPETVRRVLLCTGKIAYDLFAEKAKRRTEQVAVVRLEQLYPWPEEQLKAVLARYRHAVEWKWVQEESQNNGAWFFIEPRLRAMGVPVEYVGRDASASPATGSNYIHKHEQELLVEEAFTAVGSIAVALGRTRANGVHLPNAVTV
jgi:2-oxoglutarate dehydrogenase E1 component